MTKIFKGQISHYTNIDEFKETAIKTLNSLVHLRNKNKPYDYFDFATDEDNGQYIAVGYHDGDQPELTPVGEPVSIPDAVVITEPVADEVDSPAPAKDKAKNEKNRKQR